MQTKELADINPLLRNLCVALQPFAQARSIHLNFITEEEKINFEFRANELLGGFSKLICSIMEYMPTESSLQISSSVVEKDNSRQVSIKIKNTGINLKMVTALINKTVLPIRLFSSSISETTYEICYCLTPSADSVVAKHDSVNGALWNYISVVNQIKSHFAKLNNPVARLAETKPKEAAFLTSINNCILKNLANEQFDANALSTAMAMSRAQLLRRLKSLTGNSPGYYIKTLRLEKAKELLEKSDVSVSEAAFQAGFNSPSNFTKVFSEKYGITPSQFRLPKRDATNEQVIATNAIT